MLSAEGILLSGGKMRTLGFFIILLMSFSVGAIAHADDSHAVHSAAKSLPKALEDANTRSVKKIINSCSRDKVGWGHQASIVEEVACTVNAPSEEGEVKHMAEARKMLRDDEIKAKVANGETGADLLRDVVKTDLVRSAMEIWAYQERYTSASIQSADAAVKAVCRGEVAKNAGCTDPETVNLLKATYDSFNQQRTEHPIHKLTENDRTKMISRFSKEVAMIRLSGLSWV